MNQKNSKGKTRTISLIEHGTVIDHLNPHVVFEVVRILGIDDNVEDTVTLGTNLPSKVLGKKGIIKIANRRLTPVLVNKLAVLSPNATVSIIEDYEVKEKFKVKLPEIIEGILRCANKNCVTNIEGITTRFRLVKQDPVILMCTYCERSFRREELEVL
ncbi:MAG TPA: aspartate carbamoyltransferase regulatory subunit [Firmicutes bacterium]|nr:aspartate carbamoyltransferase regulatory subunit [Bacillota bacterium]